MVITPTERLTMPYPGLRPFEAKDQQIFFGREAQVAALLHELEDHHFVAVVGSSGSGKSSLVRAGLLPAVEEGFLLQDTDWQVLVIKPGHEPYLRLAGELVALPKANARARRIGSTDASTESEPAATVAVLRKADRGLLDALDRIAVTKRTMVVVDQFEELFAFRRDNARAEEVASRDEAAAFVKMLLRSCFDASARVWLVLTMRSDFIGHCEAFLGLPEVISHSQFLVPRLDRRQMEEAIARPGETKDASFAPFVFEEGLINRIINEAGDRPDQLPLMQHALMRTWKRAVSRCGDGPRPVELTHKDYDEAGRIEGALSLHADAAWQKIQGNPRKARIGRQLFLLLCDVSPDGQITRRRPRITEVERVTGASLQEIVDVIGVFNADDRNFLVASDPVKSKDFVDLSHEVLLRQWQLFAGEWLAEERNDVFELRLLTELSGARYRGLLSAQQVARVMPWRRRVSAAWGERYVSPTAFADAIKFVDESEAEVTAAERKRRRTVLAVGAALITATVVSSALTAMQFQSARIAEVARNEAERSKNAALASAIRAREERGKADEARAEAERLSLRAQTATREAERANEALQQKNEELKGAITRATELAVRERDYRARSYWAQLQFTEAGAAPAENDALLRISRSEPDFRRTFLSLALLDDMFAKRFNANPQAVVSAAVGLGPATRAALLQELSRLPGRAEVSIEIERARSLLGVYLNDDVLVQRLTEIKTSRDRNPIAAGQKLAAFVGTVPATRVLAERLRTEIKGAEPAAQRQALGQGLAAVVLRLNDQPLDWTIDMLVDAIKSVGDSATMQSLGERLAAVAAGVSPAEVAATVERLIGHLRSASRGQIPAIGQGLASVVGKLPDEEATRLVVQELITSRNRASDMEALGAALALALPPTSATIDGVLAAANRDGVTLSQRDGLGATLAAVARKLPEADVGRLFAKLGTGMEEQRSVLCPAVVAVAAAPGVHSGTTIDELRAAIDCTDDTDILEELGRRLERALRDLPPREATITAERLLAQIRALSDSDQLEAIGRGLATTVQKLDRDEAQRMRVRLAEEFQKATRRRRPAIAQGWAATFPSVEAVIEAADGPIESTLRKALDHRLAALADRLGPAQTVPMADRLLERMKVARDTDQRELDVAVLRALVPKLTNQQAVSRLAALIDARRGVSSPSARDQLRQALGMFALRLAEVGALPDDGASATMATLIDSIKGTEDEEALRELGRDLGAIMKKLRNRQAESAIQAVLDAATLPMDGNEAGGDRAQKAAPSPQTAADPKPARPRRPAMDSDQAKALGEGLAAGMVGLSSSRAIDMFDTILRLTRAEKHALDVLKRGLTAVTDRIAETSVPPRVVEDLIATTRDASNSTLREIAGRALVAIVSKVRETDVEPLVDKVLAAIRATPRAERLQAFDKALTAAAERIPAAAAPSLVQTLIASIRSAQGAAHMRVFGNALAVVLPRVKPNVPLTGDLVEVLKYPSVPRDELLNAMRRQTPTMPPPEHGLWATAKWIGDRRIPGVDLDASPR